MATLGFVNFSLFLQCCLPGDEAVKVHVHMYASISSDVG